MKNYFIIKIDLIKKKLNFIEQQVVKLTVDAGQNNLCTKHI